MALIVRRKVELASSIPVTAMKLAEKLIWIIGGMIALILTGEVAVWAFE
jgi:hypothetical protein